MKKLLTLAALVGAASLSYGQGLVNFANGSTTLITTNAVVSGPSVGRISGSAVTGYNFALFVAPTTQTTVDNSLTGWTLVSDSGRNTTTAGRFNGNPTVDGTAVTGYGAGSLGNFLVAGWSANIGSTWASAQAFWNASLTPGGVAQIGWFGLSGIASEVTVGGGSTPVPALFAAAGTPNTTTGFMLGRIDPTAPIPEPSTFALAGLAGAAMLIFRRRK